MSRNYGNLTNQLKIVNMLSTYLSTTPFTISTPNAGAATAAGTVVDTYGFKEALITVCINATGTNNTMAIKVQQSANAAGGAASDINDAIVDGKVASAVFPTMNLSQGASSLERKMSIRLNDGNIERYLTAHVTQTGTFPSGASIAIAALLGGAKSGPQAGKTA